MTVEKANPSINIPEQAPVTNDCSPGENQTSVALSDAEKFRQERIKFLQNDKREANRRLSELFREQNSD